MSDYHLLIQKYLNETISKKDSTTFDSIVTRPNVKDELLNYLKVESDLRAHYTSIDITDSTMEVINSKKESGDISEILKPQPKKKIIGKTKKRKKLTDTVIIPKSKVFKYNDTDSLRQSKPLRDSQRLPKTKTRESNTTRRLKNSSESGSAREIAKKKDLIYISAATAVFAIIALTVILVTLSGSTEDGLGKISKFYGQAQIRRNQQTLNPELNMKFESGDQLVLEKKAECRIKYSEESSEVVISGESRVEITSENSAKRFYMHKGIMNANVVAQPEGKPVIINTPYGKVMLDEARYRLEQNDEFMLLDIKSGFANFESASGIKKATIRAGQFAQIGPKIPFKSGVSKR